MSDAYVIAAFVEHELQPGKILTRVQMIYGPFLRGSEEAEGWAKGNIAVGVAWTAHPLMEPWTAAGGKQ